MVILLFSHIHFIICQEESSGEESGAMEKQQTPEITKIVDSEDNLIASSRGYKVDIEGEEEDILVFEDDGTNPHGKILDLRNDFKIFNTASNSKLTYLPNEKEILLDENSLADVSFGNTNWKGVGDAKIKLDENGEVEYAEFTSENGGNYPLNYQGKEFTASTGPGGRIIFNPKANEISGETSEGEIKFNTGKDSISTNNNFKINLDENGNPDRIIIEGGTYHDAENNLDYSSSGKFSVFKDGGDISNEENTISIDGSIIKSKGIVSIRDNERNIIYHGEDSEVYTIYDRIRNKFDVQNGDASISNGANRVNVENGRIIGSDEIEKFKNPKSFSVTYSENGENKQVIMLDYSSEGKVSKIYFKEGQENFIGQKDLSDSENSLEESIQTNAEIQSQIEIHKRIKEINDKIEGLEYSAISTEEKFELADLYQQRFFGSEESNTEDLVKAGEIYERIAEDETISNEERSNAHLAIAAMYLDNGDSAPTSGDSHKALIELNKALDENSNNPAAVYLKKKIDGGYFELIAEDIASDNKKEAQEIQNLLNEQGKFYGMRLTEVDRAMANKLIVKFGGEPLKGETEYELMILEERKTKKEYQIEGTGLLEDLMTNYGYSIEEASKLKSRDLAKIYHLPVDPEKYDSGTVRSASEASGQMQLAIEEALENNDIKNLASGAESAFTFEYPESFKIKDETRNEVVYKALADISDSFINPNPEEAAMMVLPFVKVGKYGRIAEIALGTGPLFEKGVAVSAKEVSDVLKIENTLAELKNAEASTAQVEKIILLNDKETINRFLQQAKNERIQVDTIGFNLETGERTVQIGNQKVSLQIKGSSSTIQEVVSSKTTLNEDIDKFVRSKISESDKESLAEEARKLVDEYGLNGFHDKVEDLGWTYGSGWEGLSDEEAAYVIKNGIRAPQTEYVYHGTTSNALKSIRDNGLNNRLATQDNGGIMMKKAVTYAGDLDYAKGYSSISSNSFGGEPVVLRFKAGVVRDEPLVYKNIISGSDSPVSSDLLEYSFDGGKTWQLLVEDTNPSIINIYEEGENILSAVNPHEALPQKIKIVDELVQSGLPEAESREIAFNPLIANQKYLKNPSEDVMVKGMTQEQIGEVGKQVRSFYAVTSPTRAEELKKLESISWPTASERANFGPGFYSWNDLTTAEKYRQSLIEGGYKNLQIVKVNFDAGQLAELNSFNVDAFGDDVASSWMSKHAQLWVENPSDFVQTNFDYVMRGTNFGTENYFKPDVFSKALSMEVIQLILVIFIR